VEDNSTTDTTDEIKQTNSSITETINVNSAVTTQPTTSLLTGKKTKVIF